MTEQSASEDAGALLPPALTVAPLSTRRPSVTALGFAERP
ncbi:hypothetical protein P3T37_006624 [Kitasatospora sp. MAA4]|nr:hypothetical protein [Kitasatospora sp. MAA4]